MDRQSDDGSIDEGARRSADIEDLRTSANEPERYRHLVEHIQDALVEFAFVDGEPVVVDVNPAFVEVFGFETGEIVGESLNEYIVPAWLEDEARQLDERTTTGEVNYRRVHRETATGLREFLYRGIPYKADDGKRCGFAVYTDLTEEERNESRIDVLHRLLRHNLRNELEVLTGNLELLDDSLDDRPVGDQLDRARGSAENLASLAKEAHEIHRTLDAPVPDDAQVDCADLTRSVVERLDAEYPAAEIDFEHHDEATVAATNRLAVAIEELVTNAIVHNPTDRARVWVEVGRASESGWTDVTVADNGPHVPEAERAVINGDADVSPLEHGSGLGLWLVRWTVERFGGTMSIDVRDTGNVVRLRIPR